MVCSNNDLGGQSIDKYTWRTRMAESLIREKGSHVRNNRIRRQLDEAACWVPSRRKPEQKELQNIRLLAPLNILQSDGHLLRENRGLDLFRHLGCPEGYISRFLRKTIVQQESQRTFAKDSKGPTIIRRHGEKSTLGMLAHFPKLNIGQRCASNETCRIAYRGPENSGIVWRTGRGNQVKATWGLLSKQSQTAESNPTCVKTHHAFLDKVL